MKEKLEVSNDVGQVSEEEEAGIQVEKKFKCDQCKNTFKSENGLKIHLGKAHKKVNSTPPPPDRLRQHPASPATIPASPLLDARREEVREEEEEECTLSTTSEEETCRNCDDPFHRLSEYFYLCCQDDKKLCVDCCSDLKVCDKMYDPVTDSWVKKVASKM